MLKVLLLLLICSTSFAAYFDMVCKTGPSIRIFMKNKIKSNVEIGEYPFKPEFRVNFTRARVRAGAGANNAANLAAGSCAWLDRPIHNDEPNCVLYYFYDGLERLIGHSQVEFLSNGMIYGQNTFVYKFTELEDLKKMNTTTGQYQHVRVRNNGKGCFIVERNGYLKHYNTLSKLQQNL